jgi:hypothetical protein
LRPLSTRSATGYLVPLSGQNAKPSTYSRFHLRSAYSRQLAHANTYIHRLNLSRIHPNDVHALFRRWNYGSDGGFSSWAQHCSCSAQDGKTSTVTTSCSTDRPRSSQSRNMLSAADQTKPPVSLSRSKPVLPQTLLPVPSNQSIASATQAARRA